MFWKRFKELCESKKKKPNTVAKELNLSNATTTHWKNGAIPKGEMLILIADYFNVSIDYLTGRTDNPEINK